MVDILLPRPLPSAMGEPAKRRPGLALCAGCGGRIQDPFLLRVSPDLEWHVACLKCAECGQPLDETCTCFLRDGKAYCKRDYGRLFGIKCAQCRAAFSSSDLVMRARDHVYHLECFRCAACGRQLLPGDQFCLRERDLLCRADHGPPPDGAAARGPRSPAPPPAHLAEPVPGRPPGPRPQSHKAAEKTTRVRTVLNEKQLHTLRTCYAANPRPDALMKEQLVEMTGLSPRVIRVWFQNKRLPTAEKRRDSRCLHRTGERKRERAPAPLISLRGGSALRISMFLFRDESGLPGGAPALLPRLRGSSAARGPDGKAERPNAVGPRSAGRAAPRGRTATAAASGAGRAAEGARGRLGAAPRGGAARAGEKLAETAAASQALIAARGDVTPLGERRRVGRSVIKVLSKR